MSFDYSNLLSPAEDEDDFGSGSQSLLDNAWSHIETENDISIPTLLDLNLGSDTENETDEVLLSANDTSGGSTTDSWVDLLEESRTSARNGDSQVLSSVSQFVGILSRTGISGPRHLKALNLKSRAVKIGSGTQFTVFKDTAAGFNEGLVIKRVNVPLSVDEGGTFAQGTEYREQLKSLELEVLALCNPVIRNHRNIARMVAWGYDYPQPDTPVPILFMEAALAPLDDFLKAEKFGKVLAEGAWEASDIKYHLALDVVAGVEAMHRLGIVHGDLKPENVLVFREKSTAVPFCAKLTDFGVCVDLENPAHPITRDDYVGTKAWLAPELANNTVTDFKPEMMFLFDSYSLGLVLMSIFTRDGGVVDLDMDGEDPVDVALYYLREQEYIPRLLMTAITASLRKYLAKDTWARALPNTDLLSTNSTAYASWLSVSQKSRQSQVHVGTIDPIYNKGPRFWYRLDETVFIELEKQYASFKANKSASFPGDVCFGLSQNVTAMKPEYLDRLVDFLTEAARQGYPPARAVYGQILGAHGIKPQVDDATLDEWTLKALSEGYLFARPSSRISTESILSAKQQFRDEGGYCTDPFLQKANIVQQAKSTKTFGNQQVVDHAGNTLFHAAAALGALDSVKELVENHGIFLDVENDNGETPLYKACQAGHADVVYYLLSKGANASIKTKSHSLTPLHWLFTFPDDSIVNIATQLVNQGGANVNAVVKSSTDDQPSASIDGIPMAHFPFQFPLGTPLHWASFARSQPAIDALVDLGADINAVYHGMDLSTTPLALAAWFSEPEIVLHLLSRGADATVRDSSGRNVLHMLSHHLPDRHGHLTHYWHYWIRHGDWDSHVRKMTELVDALVKAGADLEAVPNNDRAKTTPILLAASTSRIWDGGAICAMLAAGADVESPRDMTGDTVLHAWSSITGPRTPYPASYLHVYEQIASRAIANINVHNKWDKDTPLHLLATIYHSAYEFEAACDILWAHASEIQIDINAVNSRGMTPVFCALQGMNNDDPQRGMYLIRRGASLTGLVDGVKDMFYAVAWNRSLGDAQCYDLTVQMLAQLEGSSCCAHTGNHDEIIRKYKPVYQSTFQPSLSEQRQKSYLLSLWTAATSGRLRTTRLLLDLAITPELLNEPTRLYRQAFSNRSASDNPPETLLDSVLQYAEKNRRQHNNALRSFKAGAGRQRALTQQTAFDPNHIRTPEHAAELYANMPQILRMLRHEYGAKRAIEVIPESGDEDQKLLRAKLLDQAFYFTAGGIWDLTELYECGFTPENQPNKDEWKIVYELSSYDGDFDEKVLRTLKEMYTGGDGNSEWRPHIKLLKMSGVPSKKTPDAELFSRVRDRLLPMIMSMFKEIGKVDEAGRVWIEACDETSVSCEAALEVEILDGGKIGKTRRIKK